MKNEIYTNYIQDQRGACSTVIIGKDAAAGGHILVGHNEDDGSCAVQTHLVPRRTHAEGEMVVFEDGTAMIPQVRETCAFFWSEVCCEGGISFADSFLNEHGVFIVSDSCRPSRDVYEEQKDDFRHYGLGYALRRLVAERAHSAREGVRIAAELIETYGYCSARTYHIADAEEAWFLAVPKGHRCAAQRIRDDEIYFIPNHFQIHAVRFDDPENFYASPDVISFAKEQGWYTPAGEDDSDFDFAAAYQMPPDEEHNIRRAKDAWQILTGEEIPLSDVRDPVRKASRLYDVEDIKNVLRSLGEGTRDITAGGTVTPRQTQDVLAICNAFTVESVIAELTPDLVHTLLYRALPSPDISPYVPWFPLALTQIPDGYAFRTTAESLADHFAWDPDAIDQHNIWHIVSEVARVTDAAYARRAPLVRAAVQQFEEEAEQQAQLASREYLQTKDPAILARCTAHLAEEARVRMDSLRKELAAEDE